MVGKTTHIKIVCLFLLWTAATALQAQQPIVLTLAPDARSTAMGSLGVATSPDVNAQYFNVAKYAFFEQSGGVAFSYSPWMQALSSDMNVLNLSGVKKIGKTNSFSGSLSYFSAGEIIMTDGTESVTKSPAEWAVDLGYARQLSPYFSLGLAFRYVSAFYAERSELLTISQTSAFATDLGAYYRYPFGAHLLSAGLSLSNIGSKLRVGQNETVFLPMAMRLGVHYEMNFLEKNALGFGLEGNKSLVPEHNAEAGVFEGMMASFGNSLSTITLGVGAEYTYDRLFMVRAGYFYDDGKHSSRSHFSFGVGVHYRALLIDVSYWLPTSSLGTMDNTFHFTIGLAID